MNMSWTILYFTLKPSKPQVGEMPCRHSAAWEPPTGNQTWRTPPILGMDQNLCYLIWGNTKPLTTYAKVLTHSHLVFVNTSKLWKKRSGLLQCPIMTSDLCHGRPFWLDTGVRCAMKCCAGQPSETPLARYARALRKDSGADPWGTRNWGQS